MQHGRHGGRSLHCSKGARLTIVLLAVAMLNFHPALHAQPTAPITVYSFDIPAQPLSSALRQFAQQSRREILFTPGLVAGKQSPGVAGRLPPLRALEVLLQRTGLTWTTTPAGTILLHESPKSPNTGQGTKTRRDRSNYTEGVRIDNAFDIQERRDFPRFGFLQHARHTSWKAQPRPLSGEQRA